MDDAGRDDVEELTLERVTVVRSRRPRALWGVLAAVAVATGALVVISANDDGGTRPGLPVALGSAGRNEAAGAMAADSMLAWVTYVAGDDLPALGGEAPAYRLAGNVDEAQVRALADALGVDGELVHAGPAWRIAGDGGTLEVYEGGGAQWWYSSTTYDEPVNGSGGSAGGGVACGEVTDDVVTGCVEPAVTTVPPCLPLPADGPVSCLDVGCGPNVDCTCPPEGLCAVGGTACDDTHSDCASSRECPTGASCPPEPLPVPVDPPTPANLPSEDEARAIALDLLAATGLDVDGAEVTLDGPYEAWYVMVEPRIDGVPSGLLATVSVGADGEVTNAGGYLGTPERLGDYPMLDTRAAIDRANALQGGSLCEACDGNAEGSVSTTIACPEGNSDCNDVGVIAEPPTTYPYPCKVQADGTEICEAVEPGITCPQAAPPADEPLGAPETIECTPPLPDPGVDPVPEPEPQPVEIVLVDAEPSLVLLSAIDGSTDAYLVPGYRFTDADGGRVDLPAVADEALTGPPSTETTVPETPVLPDPGGVDPVDPQPCGDVLVEEDASGTTHTVQPNPDCVDAEAATLPAGEEPQIGVGYYVDVDTECHGGSFVLGAVTWNIAEGDASGWSSPHEGGTFTMDTPDHGTFIGDAEGSKTATFRPRSPEAEYGCDPAARG